jgi:regulator of nucleoside diphosphate kinase
MAKSTSWPRRPSARELEIYREARAFAGALVLAAGSAAHTATSTRANAMLTLSVVCLCSAWLIERRARAVLLDRWIAEGVEKGMGKDQATLRARDIFSAIDDEPRPRDAVTTSERGPAVAPDLTITRLDLTRLSSVLDSMGSLHEDASDRLHEELQRATVVASEDVPPDVVTMNSRVLYRDESGSLGREVTLVYPDAADAARQRVSILSPLGSALLGLRVGQAIEWDLPNGQRKRYRVLALPYQPEAHGHFQL